MPLNSHARTVAIGHVKIGGGLPLVLIAGPCQLESRDHAMDMAGRIADIAQRLKMPWIFKTSFDKANRTSVTGARGLGLEKSLPIFQDIRRTYGCPVLTDVHHPEHCALVEAGGVDVIQIPAFLCRQTDLLLAAARTSCAINIKKGQFLAPWDMKNVIKKMESEGHARLMLCERGTSFGYNTLVSDMRSLPILRETGYPVIFDATHSVQQPGGLGQSSGGQREYVPILARAAIAVGVDGVFIETHDDPDHAPSDGPNMVPIQKLEGFLRILQEFDALAKAYPHIDVSVKDT